MSRIPSKSLNEYPWYVRFFLKRQRRVYGEILAPSLLWGRLPGAFVGMLGLLGIFNSKRYPVDGRLRSLVSIRIAQLNGCHFCVDLNAYNFLKARGDEARAAAVADWRDSALFDDAERAALDWAEQVTERCAAIDETAPGRLREHFSDDEITGLTAWIGFQNMSAKFNAALGAEQHGFCDLRQQSEDR
ncbi:carboxymuconolactone decarboxylase family protein [Wenzhouxiangella limi]|uniref:Carboxymuconolactone decarboxylase family protein n=1 Tax=Wenzhouxiangella limi TaxID=2707351 RepID=A0A845V5F6_9GAMM|nr:carboxymuconolactone decarboxylase family protein [Wenzhouxiangella limi]NDY95441.1 carboxymuconolactone decarboxylase family protein [Wenzhouxiangella limi]